MTSHGCKITRVSVNMLVTFRNDEILQRNLKSLLHLSTVKLCSTFSGPGVKSMENVCCTNDPDVVCDVTCSAGYSHTGSHVVECTSGTWNTTAEDICTPERTSMALLRSSSAYVRLI